MAVKKLYTQEQVEAARAALLKLREEAQPDSKRFNSQAVFAQLTTEIKALRTAGYSLEQIAARLNPELGLTVAPKTIATYARTARRAPARKSKPE